MGGIAEGSFGGIERARKITEEPQFIDAPEHPSVVELLAYFERQRGDREMADRADIKLTEIARFMPNMIITEAVDGGEDFRTRLFGTALVELLGEERTGKLLSEFAEEGAIATDKDAVQRRWLYITRQAFFGRKPIFLRVPFAASGHPLSGRPHDLGTLDRGRHRTGTGDRRHVRDPRGNPAGLTPQHRHIVKTDGGPDDQGAGTSSAAAISASASALSQWAGPTSRPISRPSGAISSVVGRPKALSVTLARAVGSI